MLKASGYFLLGYAAHASRRLAAFLCTLLLVCTAFFARNADAAAPATPPVQLASSSPRHDLAGHLSLLRDPSGRLTLEQVREAGPQAFTAIPGHVSLGFIRDVVWLRFVVERPSTDEADHWWFALSHVFLQQVEVYMVEGDERLPAAARPARAAPVSADILAGRLPVFDLPMPTPGVRTYYLRVQSQASMSLIATLWRPDRLAAVNSFQSFAWGGLFGAYVLVILFYMAFWAWTREQLHGVYVFYVLFNFLAALFTGGWPQHLWPGLSTDTSLTLLGVWLTLPVLVGSWFSMLLLGVHRHWPRLFRGLLRTLAVVVSVVVVLVLLGHYQRVIPTVQTLSIGLIGFFFSLALYLILRGDRAAWFFLGAFSFFYIGVAWRYLRNIGLIEPSFWNDNSYQIGAFVHMLVMSIGIFSRYGSLRRETEEARARVEAEASLRAEQRDFMAMVSHEFRTPLSIINATTHNLLRDTQLPAGARDRVMKVVRANERMSSLMETYLANERLLLDKTQPDLAACDLLAVCRAVCEDLADLGGPRPVLRGPAGVLVMCDEDMLRIALTNLATNAHRHSPPGAAVEIEVSADDRQARVDVRDQGTGVPPEDMEHLFKRFYRGRNALDTHGAGLGLYLVQVIARRHGGSVAARNLQPTGCEFTLRLPLGATGPHRAG